MRKTFINIFSYLLRISLMVGCASKNEATPAPIAESGSNQPVLLTGTYQVTNSFVLTEYFVENAVALVDMHAFVIRDEEWEIPVESQVLGLMTFDAETLSGTYDLSLPAQPRGEFNDVDQDADDEEGVQVQCIAHNARHEQVVLHLLDQNHGEQHHQPIFKAGKTEGGGILGQGHHHGRTRADQGADDR